MPGKVDYLYHGESRCTPTRLAGQSEETKRTLLRWFLGHFLLSDCGRSLCRVLSIRDLFPWILQDCAYRFRAYSLQLIMQKCGQCSLLYSGAVPELFKTTGIICLQKEKFREVILKAFPLALSMGFYFKKKQLPSN